MSVFGVDIGGLGPSSVFHSRVVFFDFDTGLSSVIFYLTLLVVIYVVITKDVTVVISFVNFGVTEKSQIIIIQLQSTLGFATMGIAANLGIATTTPLTDLCHYIIATLDITTSNFGLYVAK